MIYGTQTHGDITVELHKGEDGDRYARCEHSSHGIYGWTSWSGRSGDVIAALADEHIDAHLVGRYPVEIVTDADTAKLIGGQR